MALLHIIAFELSSNLNFFILTKIKWPESVI